jgi:inositol-phosphate phosphatase/L-galactose 1-phosphate phosphatase
MSSSSSAAAAAAPTAAFVNLTHCLEVATRLARQAGAIQRGAESATLDVTSKGGIDLVTDIDKRCEHVIFNVLREQFPTHCFIGEESAADVELTDAPTWCVDPVDGTTNFVHRFPFFCVSIGLFVKKRSVMGVIYNAVSDRLYSAVKGEGAFCNGQPMHVDDDATSLDKAVVCTNIGHSRDASILQGAVDDMHALLRGNLRGIRMTGSCCLAMCHVAQGCVSAYYEKDVGGLWDVCAGIVIVKEAGGVVLLPDGSDGADIEPCTSGKQRLICGNAGICGVILRQQEEALVSGAGIHSASGVAVAAAPPASKKRKTTAE